MKKQKNIKNIAQALYIVLAILFFSGCANVIPIEDCLTNDIHGFWGGLWHGIISPVSFIISLFNDSVAMYAVNNNGRWYDFGFVLGAGILFGSGGSSTKK
jgi:hypothetical protein